MSYQLGKSADVDEYTLKVSSRAEHFRLVGYTANPLIEAAGLDCLLTIDSPVWQGNDVIQDEGSPNPS